MGYSPWGHKASARTEVTQHECSLRYFVTQLSHLSRLIRGLRESRLHPSSDGSELKRPRAEEVEGVVVAKVPSGVQSLSKRHLCAVWPAVSAPPGRR